MCERGVRLTISQFLTFPSLWVVLSTRDGANLLVWSVSLCGLAVHGLTLAGVIYARNSISPKELTYTPLRDGVSLFLTFD